MISLRVISSCLERKGKVETVFYISAQRYL
jgi:hypothetical protein